MHTAGSDQVLFLGTLPVGSLRHKCNHLFEYYGLEVCGLHVAGVLTWRVVCCMWLVYFSFYLSKKENLHVRPMQTVFWHDDKIE
jgi:hypothetical protein